MYIGVNVRSFNICNNYYKFKLCGDLFIYAYIYIYNTNI